MSIFSPLRVSVLGVPLFVLCGLPISVLAFDVPDTMDQGLSSKVLLSGAANIGSTNATSFSIAASLNYRLGRSETRTEGRFQRSTTRVDVPLVDDGGVVTLDDNGELATEEVSERTSDRRFLALEQRWYFSNDRLFAFGLIDADRDRPSGVDTSTREVLGIGYRLWTNKNNFLAAGAGVGHKRFVPTDGADSESGIGYIGVKLSLDTSERTRLRSELDTDFGGENDFTEFSISLGVEVSEVASLSLGYEARVNGGFRDGSDPDVDGLESRFEVGLRLDFP